MNAHGSGEASLERVARDVLDSLLEGCQVIGFDWRYLYVNEAVALQGRKSKAELLGRTMLECYPGLDQTPFFQVLRRCMSERKHDRMENEFTYPDGKKASSNCASFLCRRARASFPWI